MHQKIGVTKTMQCLYTLHEFQNIQLKESEKSIQLG